eukprot:Hpha_TRINITY_DN16465_c1_g11::TRINITY_DN16465_c1_g11_i1::g.160774::m.160774/K12405/HSD17B4; 3-hydroxyacyl-CoA dehydrogenase / 3a,7a,12a-trihydroxy-5b-cholest-24-enoyl-CoA hydratase / enoyl-CoA hydratase 2
MANTLRFGGRVAIVTGAGQGLGRVYAKELAQRGCMVVVNDMQGKAADSVVTEIQQAGGKAVASYGSVVDGDAIVKKAIDSFGRVDIVINNAGIIRDMSFKRMGPKEWDAVIAVHLKGAYAVTRAAWRHMQEQEFGRIVNVSSPAGLYGNFGQCNYSTAKMGLVGFTQSLSKEGEKKNIRANIIAPFAWTQMLETIMPKAAGERLKPEYVAALVLYLCHESCKGTGGIYETGAGVYQRIQLSRAKGYWHDVDAGDPTPEDIAARWSEINDMKGSEVVNIKTGVTFPQMKNLNKKKGKL